MSWEQGQTSSPAEAQMTTSDEPDVHRCWICGSPARPVRPSTITRAVDDASVRIKDSNYGDTAALSE